jgi:hypothetical protein
MCLQACRVRAPERDHRGGWAVHTGRPAARPPRRASVPLSASAMRAAAGDANSTNAKPLPTLVLASRTTRTAVTPAAAPAGAAPGPPAGPPAAAPPTRLNARMTSSSCAGLRL